MYFDSFIGTKAWSDPVIEEASVKLEDALGADISYLIPTSRQPTLLVRSLPALTDVWNAF